MKEEKKKSKIKKTKEKGITLIVLVITIVILIILATVTLNVVLGEGGLIQRAQQAKDLTEQATLEEQEGLNSLMSEYANIMAEDNSPKDTTPPTVNIVIETITENSIQITANAQDNESGLAIKGTYKYYLNNELKATLEEDTYTFTELEAGTTYNIKVVVADNAGNEATKEENIKTDEGIILKELNIDVFGNFQYIDGMTWYEWVNSEYNTTDLKCYSNDSFVITGNVTIRLNNVDVKGKDLILENAEYKSFTNII